MAKERTTTYLSCQGCKGRNYTQVVSKGRTAGSLQLKKFCARCRGHIDHKESK